jgi:hypothetical protein
MKHSFHFCFVLFSLFCTALSVDLSAQTSAWEPMNNGFMHLLVYTIEIDPVDSLVMYCGTDYGNIYKTSDGGFNWRLSQNGIPSTYSSEYVSALYLDKQDRRTIYAGFGGRQTNQNLFVSTDSGSSWNNITTPGNWKTGGILYMYEIKSPKHRFFCGLGWSQGIYYSDDFKSWKQVLSDQGVQTIGGHPLNPSHVYAGTSAISQLHRSTDFGDTWHIPNKGFSVDKHTGVRTITPSPSDSSLLYLGVTKPGPGMFKTHLGTNWTSLNNIDQISEIAIHPKNENIMYLSAIGTGVKRTTDGGATWVTLNAGLPTTDIMRVRIAPGYPIRVFAVTLKHGIYRLVDEEIPENIVTFRGAVKADDR